MSLDTIQQLQSEIGPNTLGIFWQTTSDFKSRPIPFDELDYLFDGMLSKQVFSDFPVTDKNIFLNDLFGNKVFLCHLSSSNEAMNESIKESLGLFKIENDPKVEILLINVGPGPTKILQKLRPEIQVKQIDF